MRLGAERRLIFGLIRSESPGHYLHYLHYVHYLVIISCFRKKSGLEDEI